MSSSEKTGAMAVQHGGNHYKEMKIEVVEFCEANNIPFLEGTVIKHIARHRLKNKAEDIKKAIHYSQIILRLVYGIDSNISFNENETEGNTPFSNPPGTYSYKGKVMSAAEIAEDIAADAGAAQIELDIAPAPKQLKVLHMLDPDNPLIRTKEIILGQQDVERVYFPGPNHRKIRPTTMIELVNKQSYEVLGKLTDVKEILYHNRDQMKVEALKKERKVRRYPAVIYDNHDGDTVSAEIKLGMGLTLDEKCRLRGINAPELNTVKGKQARNHLHDLLEEYAQDIDPDEPQPYTMVEIVEGDERDKYGRLLVRIIGINPGESDQEVDINQLMIDNGQAVEYMAWAENDDFDNERKYQLLHDACWELFNAPKSKPMKSRMNAQEIKALEKIKNLISDN